MTNLIDNDLKISKGAIVRDKKGVEWVFIGYRVTSVGSFERVFCQLIEGHWPNCMRVYKASKVETIKRKFDI